MHTISLSQAKAHLSELILNSSVQATDITEYTENMEVMPRFKGPPKE